MRLQNRLLGGRNWSLSATIPQCSHLSIPGGRSSGGAAEAEGVEAEGEREGRREGEREGRREREREGRREIGMKMYAHSG